MSKPPTTNLGVRFTKGAAYSKMLAALLTGASTTWELTWIVHIGYGAIRRYLNYAHSIKIIYVDRWVREDTDTPNLKRGPWQAAYALGSKPDAPKPTKEKP